MAAHISNVNPQEDVPENNSAEASGWDSAELSAWVIGGAAEEWP